MEYPIIENQVVFLKDTDIVQDISGNNTLNSVVLSNGIASYNLVSAISGVASADIKYLSGVLSDTVDLKLAYVSSEVSSLIKRDNRDLTFLGNVELANEYFDPESGAITLNTLYGLMLTNRLPNGNEELDTYTERRNRALHVGYVFKATASDDLYDFTVSDGSNELVLHNNDYIIVTSEVDAISSIKTSDIHLIKSAAKSEYLLSTYISEVETSLSAYKPHVYMLTGDNTASVEALIGADEILSSKEFNNADIVIVTTLANSAEVADNIKIAYQFNKDANTWNALIGNFNAKNCILTHDIVCAGEYELVGNITKAKTGTLTIPAKGKSIDDVLTRVFTTELSGYVSTPVAVTLTALTGEYEVGSNVTLTANAAFNPGAYYYGPDTGVLPNNWTFTLSGTGVTTLTKTQSGKNTSPTTLTFDEIQVLDNFSPKMSISVSHLSSTNYANTNLGRENTIADFNRVKINAGTVSKTNVTSITSYRKIFIGSTADSGAITSAMITALSPTIKSSAIAAAGTTYRVSASSTYKLVPNAKRIIVAVPAEGSHIRKLKEVKLFSASNTPVTDSYTSDTSGPVLTLSIPSANNALPVTYNVYVYEPASIGAGEIHDITLTR